jgi:uncharacterized protein
VVAVFRSLEGESLEDYSIRLAEQWKVGQKGLDNGVIFLVFLQDRKMRLEVGYGLEPTLTDAVASTILSTAVAPRFREGRLADGIEAGLDAIDAAIRGEFRGAPREKRDDGIPLLVPLLFTLLVILGIGFSAYRNAAYARRQGWTGGAQGWGRRGAGGWGGWGGGGFGGGFSGGGGSGGGFSGGGGSFGGGGSSGSW